MFSPPSTNSQVNLRRMPYLRILACIISASCMVWASPDRSLWWLGFFAWIPWLWAIEGLSGKKAWMYGWLAGTITVFWGFIWMTELLENFAGFSLVPTLAVHLLFAAGTGLQWALPAAIIAKLRGSNNDRLLWLVPLAWAASEAIVPQVFPSYLALMWCWQPRWIQLAEIGGVTTVSFAMVALNTSLYVVLHRLWIQRRVHKKALFIWLALMIGIPAYGTIRMAQVDNLMAESPKLSIGVVQGNFGISEWGLRRDKLRILANLQYQSAKLEQQGAELLLWGETAYPFSRVFSREHGHDLPLNDPRRVRRDFSVPLILGTVTENRKLSPYAWNSALVLERDGHVGNIYDKVFPLYFGEYIPLVDPGWYLEKIPSASYINRGIGPVVLEAAGYRFGPLICYEDILPRFTRNMAQEGIHAFVNLTNDSWFGKSKEQSQHLGLAIFRTIENRRAMLRSVNAGISAYIDANGRVIHQTKVTNPDEDGPQLPDGFVAEVPMIAPEKTRTLYTRTGELFNGLLVFILIAFGIRQRTLARNHKA